MATSSDVRVARKWVNMTVEQAAKLVHVTPTTWRRWETSAVSGREMPQLHYEMFLLLTDQHLDVHLAPGAGKATKR